MATAIKIPRDVFLQKLKDKLTETDKNETINEKRRAEYEKTEAKWRQDVVKHIYQTKPELSNVYASFDKTVTIYTKAIPDLPACPPLDLLPNLSHWERNELLQTIAIVELTDAEFVPASITKNASRFLI